MRRIRMAVCLLIVSVIPACASAPPGEPDPATRPASEPLSSADTVRAEPVDASPAELGTATIDYSDSAGELIQLTIETPTIAPPVGMGGGVGARMSPFAGVEIDLGTRTVEIVAQSCLDAGYLEQIVCSPGSREHEALLVTAVRPSDIHAALLLAGFEPGHPGGWAFDENERLRLERPTGSPVAVSVRYVDSSGEQREHDVGLWITTAEGDRFPRTPWTFGGSMIKPNSEFMGPGEHYVADMTGSIVGLVTFGDEVVGWSQVVSDKKDVHPQEWQVAMDRVPPLDTPVTLLLRPGK